MHDFKYKRNQLYCENVPIQKIARQTGTPVFVYSKKTLLDHYRKLHHAFAPVPHLICYSVKSNPNLTVCRTLVRAGAGLDIVSGGELYRAKKIGASPRKIVYAGVGKTATEIEQALKSNILFFTVESLSELQLINEIARRLRLKAPVALRINPEINPDTHHYISTGKKGTKFGFGMGTGLSIYKSHQKLYYINFVGIQMHIGSQITNPQPFVTALKKLLPLIRDLRSFLPSIQYLDIGGGLGIIYQNEKPSTATQFARAVLPLINGLGLTIILEPGRFIAGNAGILVIRVLYRKKSAGKNFIIVDGAMNDLIRPSLYRAYHHILPLNKKGGRAITADIVGPVCETGDFLARDRKIAPPKEGDLLAVMSAGAYGFAMSSNYNSRPRAAEVMVTKNNFRVIRNRETYPDLIRNEKY